MTGEIMNQQITIGIAQKLTSPNPFAILTVKKPNSTDNVMAVSWWTYTSNHPASLAVCLSKKSYSGSCIQAARRFSVNIVAEHLREAAFRCGTCSGRDHNKVAEFAIPIAQDDSGIAYVAGSRVSFFCELTDSVPVGDHVLYLAKIEKIFGDASVPGLYAWDGYTTLATASVV